MRKKLLFIVLVLILYPITYFGSIIPKNNKELESVAPLSKEQVCHAYIADITSKYTKEPLKKHYGMDLPYQLEDVKVIDAKLIYGENKLTYIFVTQLQPFVGAHNPIGTDEFTFRIENGKVTMENYKHIESFPVPEHLKPYYKSLNPNY
ncbi:MAG: DUF3888 domain-containing protein [Clostridiaceae bacterium]